MILIVGNNHDDLIYFESIMNEKKNELILNRYPAVTGTISNQEVILLENVYTNIVSSMICSYLIEKRYVLFIIKVGKVNTLSKDFRDGDVVVSRKIVGFDVDVTDIKGVSLGQIPNYPSSYSTVHEIRNMLINAFQKRGGLLVKNCCVYSSNTHFSKPDQLKDYIIDERILGEPLKDIVFDSESFGIAVASVTHEIPVVTIGVVLNHIGDEFDPDNYIKTLNKYSDIGKAVCNLIGEVASSNVERG